MASVSNDEYTLCGNSKTIEGKLKDCVRQLKTSGVSFFFSLHMIEKWKIILSLVDHQYCSFLYCRVVLACCDEAIGLLEGLKASKASPCSQDDLARAYLWQYLALAEQAKQQVRAL